MEKDCNQRPGQRFRLGSGRDYIETVGRAGQMDPALPAFLLDMISFSCHESPGEGPTKASGWIFLDVAGSVSNNDGGISIVHKYRISI